VAAEAMGSSQDRVSSRFRLIDSASFLRAYDEVVQVTFEDEQWHGMWHGVRDGAVVAVVGGRLGRVRQTHL
jgi:hypothetical protein